MRLGSINVHIDSDVPCVRVEEAGETRWIDIFEVGHHGTVHVFLAGTKENGKDAATLRAMAKALNEAAEKIDPRPWVKLTATNRQANVETGVVYDVSPPLEQDTPPQFGQPESEE